MTKVLQMEDDDCRRALHRPSQMKLKTVQLIQKTIQHLLGHHSAAEAQGADLQKAEKQL